MRCARYPAPSLLLTGFPLSAPCYCARVGVRGNLHQSTDVLVCSTRPVPRLADLRADELAELMHAVQRVGRVVERAYDAEGLTVACQVSSAACASRFFLADGCVLVGTIVAGRACIRTDRPARPFPRPPTALAGRSIRRLAKRRRFHGT